MWEKKCHEHASKLGLCPIFKIEICDFLSCEFLSYQNCDFLSCDFLSVYPINCTKDMLEWPNTKEVPNDR